MDCVLHLAACFEKVCNLGNSNKHCTVDLTSGSEVP